MKREDWEEPDWSRPSFDWFTFLMFWSTLTMGVALFVLLVAWLFFWFLGEVLHVFL